MCTAQLQAQGNALPTLDCDQHGTHARILVVHPSVHLAVAFPTDCGLWYAPLPPTYKLPRSSLVLCDPALHTAYINNHIE
jgi:hypothetical protein